MKQVGSHGSQYGRRESGPSVSDQDWAEQEAGSGSLAKKEATCMHHKPQSNTGCRQPQVFNLAA